MFLSKEGISMTLHKQTKEFLSNSAQFYPVHTLSPENFREVAVATAISKTYNIHTEIQVIKCHMT